MTRHALVRRLYFVAAAVSMLLCALLFFPWFLPRESLCGLVGRWCVTETGWKRRLAQLLRVGLDDWPGHPPGEDCVVIFMLERRARAVMYQPEELP